MQVLLIESDPLLASSIVAYMHKQGMQISSVTTAQGAIAACDTSTPNIVILDMALIGHGGIEFLHEFRSYHDWQNVPVIAWSMQHITVTQSQALLQLGVSGVLYKPKTTLQQLYQQLQTFIPSPV